MSGAKLTAALGVSTGTGAISLVLIASLDGIDEPVQTIQVGQNPVQTFAECIGVAVAATPEITAIGICVGDPSQQQQLTEALQHEGITNFHLVDHANAVAAYSEHHQDSDRFVSATTVLARGAAAYAYRRKAVRNASASDRPRKIPGGPVAAAVAAIVCATAITVGYGQGRLDSTEGAHDGESVESPAPRESAEPRVMWLDVRPVNDVSTRIPETAARLPDEPVTANRDVPLEVTMPGGNVVEVALPPYLEPPSNIKAWLRQFLMPPADPSSPAPFAPLPIPPALR